MEWLNYHHLFYFWTVAREGSIARASKALRVAPPTISAQLKALEDSLGEPLFERVGRGLVLTDVGRTAQRYADEIFSLGRELLGNVKRRASTDDRRARVVVGVDDAVPKLIAHRLLAPLLRGPQRYHLVCHEGGTQALLEALSQHTLDVVLTDAPVPPEHKLRAFNHVLGECDLTVLGARALCEARAGAFPKSLDGAPMLLPGPGVAVRRAIDAWLDAEGVRPDVVGEFDDSALLKVFGAHAAGFFLVPTVIARTVAKQHGVKVVGRVPAVRERYVAITVERRIKHPAVVTLCDAARRKLFA